MKLKYKIILLLIFTISIASIPLSLYLLNRHENDRIAMTNFVGEANSRILARTSMNIILMNGGNIDGSMVDIRDMMNILAPLKKNGLVYADSVLISPDLKINGIILAKFTGDDIPERVFSDNGKVPTGDIERLLSHGGKGEIPIPELNRIFYEFVSSATIPGGATQSIGRLVFSRDVILAPIRMLRYATIAATIIAIITASLIGFFSSRVITHPVQELTTAAKRIKSGDLSNYFPRPGNDEIAELSDAFARMIAIINSKINELTVTNRKLAGLDAIKDEFLANISHELRTPLNGMIGIAESLINGASGRLEENTIHDLDLIAGSGRRLSLLVNEILDFSKLKNSNIELNLRPTDISSVISLSVLLMTPLARKKNIELKSSLPRDLPAVMADENRLQQILLNIIGNAVKFTETGSITVDASICDENPEMVTIRVADTGIGIASEMLSSIFDPFLQAQGVNRNVYEGAGLGLTITKNLVELHGGSIGARSEFTRGSEFFFTLRICPEETGTCEISSTDIKAREKARLTEEITVRPSLPEIGDSAKVRGRILVAEDDPVSLQMMINHLSIEGYETEISRNGQDALSLVYENTPDLVIMNVLLPHISGYEVCGILRKKYSPYHLPILMLTSRINPGDIASVFEAGANDYIEKPVSKEELLARAKNLITLKESIEVHDRYNKIDYELSIAQDIQRSLLPGKSVKITTPVIAVRHRPMSAIGGDYYSIHRTGGKKTAVLLADVSGHGIPAAIISAKLEIAYSVHRGLADNPALLFREINSIMCDFTHDQYMTACFILIDEEAGKLKYSNAGHKPIIILRGATGELEENTVSGKPIGIFPDLDFNNAEIGINRGDRIILYTDGVVEARNRNREQFGHERFNELILKYAGKDPEELADAVLFSLERWLEIQNGMPLDDDVTLIIIDL